MPKRIQLRRTKGWRKPEGAVVVARPTKWGNPHSRAEVIKRVQDDWIEKFSWPATEARQIAEITWREEAVRLFREYLEEMDEAELQEFLGPLRGKDLACWCPLDAPCHADVLIELAQRTEKNE